MSCEHGNPHAACDLCAALHEAYKRGYAAGGIAALTTPTLATSGSQAGEVVSVLRRALEYVGYRTDGDVLTIAKRAEHWMRGSEVLIKMRGSLIEGLEARLTTPTPADSGVRE